MLQKDAATSGACGFLPFGRTYIRHQQVAVGTGNVVALGGAVGMIFHLEYYNVLRGYEKSSSAGVTEERKIVLNDRPSSLNERRGSRKKSNLKYAFCRNISLLSSKNIFHSHSDYWYEDGVGKATDKIDM
jgi:hypothetical protein